MEGEAVKILCTYTDDDTQEELVYFQQSAVGASNELVAKAIRSSVGVGKPFLAFHNAAVSNALTAAPAWNPNAYPAPIVSEDWEANLAAINAMLADQQLQQTPNDSVFAA